MRLASVGFLCCALLATSLNATAHLYSSAGVIKQGAARAPDLEFPKEAATPSFFDTPAMRLYKPEGAGPFPAVVLVHQCGGLGSGRGQNTSMLQWAKEAVARGYVALLIDSLGPRGADSVCLGPKQNITFPVGVKDALQAAEHLRRFDFVDKQRIGLAGHSWGAMVAVLASGKLWGQALAPGERFAAAVAFYPGYFTLAPKNFAPYEIVNPDIDKPLLVLMGEDDNETPAEDCVKRLDPLIKAGAPVELHTYPKTTHCWDCKHLDSHAKTDFRGNHVVYRYNREVTEDSARRMFDFFERTMPKKP